MPDTQALPKFRISVDSCGGMVYIKKQGIKVEVYSFITQKPGNKPPGYVLASNDVRVGNFLAIVEEGSLDDEELAWFNDIVYEGISAYIDSVIAEYDSITEEEVAQAIAAHSAARTIDIDMQTETGFVGWDGSDGTGDGEIVWYYDSGYYKHLGVEEGYKVKVSYYWFDGHYAALPTTWNQTAPYNHLANSLRGGLNDNYYVAGCLPIVWPR